MAECVWRDLVGGREEELVVDQRDVANLEIDADASQQRPGSTEGEARGSLLVGLLTRRGVDEGAAMVADQPLHAVRSHLWT